MKHSLSILLSLELGFAIWLASSTCLLRTAFADALRAVHEQPSSASAIAEFKHQQFLSSLAPWVFGACVFGALALPTWGMDAWRRRRSARAVSRATPVT